MTTEDQSETIAWLGSPSTHGGGPVSITETHASVVFVSGARAFKLKRAVLYDYLDFSSAERRRAMCEAELRINRRTAPALYRQVRAITRNADGSLALDGPGVPIDWFLEMERFDEDLLLDRLAVRGVLDLALMRPLGAEIARFHLAAERRPDHGGAAGMTWVIDGNALGYRRDGAGVVDPEICMRLTEAARAELARRAALLDTRRRDGWVRQCHGDLHLRNIVLLAGHPTLFDGVEFNDEIACVDAFYDLAFLLMDLWHRGLRAHANAILNAYLGMLRDDAGLPLLPLFASCRAAIRAKTAATAATLQSDRRQREALVVSAREYLALAMDLLQPAPARVIAIGGVSGTGKSTLARALAPSVGRMPGAVVVRSDEIRKELAGVPPLTRLGAESYLPDVNRHVYGTLIDRIGAIVQSGQSAIADAVFAHAADREAVETAATRLGAGFEGFWLDAPDAVLTARLHERREDASDADAAVLRQQRAQPTGPIAWRRVETSGATTTIVEAMRRAQKNPRS